MTGNRLVAMMRAARRQVARLAVLAVILVVAFYFLSWPTNYLILRPGQAVDVGPMISVDGQAGESQGLLMTTVFTNQARLWLAVVGAFHPGIDMVHLSNILRPGQTIEEYYLQNQWLMKDSQALAIQLAFEQLGYPVHMAGEGAVVTYVLPDAPAHGELKVGDVITHLDSMTVQTGDELLAYLQEISPGDIVAVRYAREQEIASVEIETGEHPEDAMRSYIGIMVLTAGPQVIGPSDVTIDAGEVGGPSAGLMFTLQVMGRYDRELVPQGLVIAGTGILDRDANVNPVGGVRQKVQAAEKAGADVFLVPAANAREAEQAATTVDVFPVGNLDEAVQVLFSLDKAS